MGETLVLLEHLLAQLVAHQASDLHLSAERAACWRVHGELAAMDERRWTPAMMDSLLQELLGPTQASDYAAKGSVDLGYSTRAGERFRINVFRSLGKAALVARHLPAHFRSFHELRLPESIRGFSALRDGLVLVTGITGSGKSTTLATIINEINNTRAAHILSIEDPVEFVHAPKQSLISHRELYTDVPDFASAVKSALREDPDVILVGELRDTETMRAALTAAETGHLVLSTLHTADTSGAIERFVGGFPGNEQSIVRNRLALVLKAVVSQQLLPLHNRPGRVAAVEVLQVTPAVANLIASGRTVQIYSAIESGRDAGMQTFDQSLTLLCRDGLIAPEDGRRLARDPAGFERLTRMGRSAL
ncbi:MAG: type IV pilus twitching motility protein PilT [Rhodoferax sp.]